jgi:hypothetical protein
VRLTVRLSPRERARYDALMATRNRFLAQCGIRLGSVAGWQTFVHASARSRAGRRAMLAHREARALAFGTAGKLRVLADLLAEHHPARTLVFTEDTAMVYRIARTFLIPAITHHTAVKERHDLLQRFRAGEYPVVVASRVLNEGVDVPEASVAIVLSGTGSRREYVQRLGRILRRQEGKRAVLYEVVAEATSEEQVSCRRRAGAHVGMHPQGDPQAPDLFANLEQDTPMSQRVQPGLGGRPILPAELLIQRVHADEMVPCRLPLTDDTLTPATDLIALSRVAHGRTRGKLDAELQVLEGDQTDYRLKRGLAHLLTHDFSTFEVESPVEPPLLRQRVFALSASSIPSPQRTSETLAAVADALSQELTRDISAEQVRAWLYADRPDEQVLTTVDEPTPETLLTATTWRRPRACCTAPTRWCSRRTAMTPANTSCCFATSNCSG